MSDFKYTNSSINSDHLRSDSCSGSMTQNELNWNRHGYYDNHNRNVSYVSSHFGFDSSPTKAKSDSSRNNHTNVFHNNVSSSSGQSYNNATNNLSFNAKKHNISISNSNSNYFTKKVNTYFSDYSDLHTLFTQNQIELAMWVCFIFLTFLIAKKFSNFTFSAILTLGLGLQCFGFILLAYKVFCTKFYFDLSANSMIIWVVCLISRFYSTVRFNGYLPVDSTGDYIYQIIDFFSLVLCLSIYTKMVFFTTEGSKIRENLSCLYIILPCLVMAVLIHPNLNHNFWADVCWTFSLYLETFSLMPQLVILIENKEPIENYTAHYLASNGCSRFLTFLFWMFSRKELVSAGSSVFSSYVVLFSYLVQLILVSDFMYEYLKSINDESVSITMYDE